MVCETAVELCTVDRRVVQGCFQDTHANGTWRMSCRALRASVLLSSSRLRWKKNSHMREPLRRRWFCLPPSDARWTNKGTRTWGHQEAGTLKKHSSDGMVMHERGDTPIALKRGPQPASRL
eukprot:jgi/Mesvir1/14258/Mv25156-RA.1